MIEFVMFGGSVGGMIYLHYNYSYPVMNVTQEVSKNIKVAKNLPKSSLTTLDVLYLILVHIDGNVDKKFQPPSFTGAEKIKFIFKGFLRTDGNFTL